MKERQSLQDSKYKLFVGAFSNYGGWNTKKSISLTDSEFQTFPEGKENQYTKRKTESYVFSGFGVSISLAWEWKSKTGKFATGRFWPFTWKTSSVGRDNVNKWEFCKLKITTIVVFTIMIQRIFPSEELAPTRSTTVIRGLSIHLFSFNNEVGFSSQERAIVFIW